MEEEKSVNMQEVATPVENDSENDSQQVENVEENTEQVENETTNATETTNSTTQEQSPEQNKDINSVARQVRIKAEKEAEAKIQEAYQKGIKDAENKSYFGKTNPYTFKTIEDELDVEQFKLMQKIEEEGGDPLIDYASKIKEQEKQKIIAEHKEQEKQAQQQKLQNEIDNLISKHPNLDIEGLLQDKSFNSFAKGKVGVQPLEEIYSDYSDLQNQIKQSINTQVQLGIEKERASTGSLSSGGNESLNFDTMSSAEFQAYKDKILNN